MGTNAIHCVLHVQIIALAMECVLAELVPVSLDLEDKTVQVWLKCQVALQTVQAMVIAEK